MEETKIAETLKQNVPDPAPTPTQHPSAPEVVPEDHSPVEMGLDELTQYKLHDVFNEQYDPKDEITKAKLSYIYDEVSKLAESDDYVEVVAKIRSLLNAAGIAHHPKQISRLHEWLRLRNVANKAFVGMENLRG